MSDTWNSGGMGSTPGWLGRMFNYTNLPPADDPDVASAMGRLRSHAAAQAAGAPPQLSPADIPVGAGWPTYGGHSTNYGDPDAIARARALADAQAQLNAGSPPNTNRPPTLGPVAPIQSAAQMPVQLPLAPSGPPPAPAPVVASRPGGIGSDANFPVLGVGGFATTYGAPGQQPPELTGSPAVASGGAPASIRARGTGGRIPPTATASVPPVVGAPGTSGDPNRWMIDRMNAPATQGQPSRGMQTALDLSGLFGGGRTNPADVPAPAATPMSGGVLSKNGLSQAPWNVGPLQKGQVFSSEMGPFTEKQRAARSLKQRYG